MEKKKGFVPFHEKLAYGFGDAGCNFIWSTISMFVTMYYTDSVGLSAAAVGTMMLIARLLDGFSDIGMGLVIDRTNTRWGKARPWIFLSAPAMALGLILLFNVPTGFSITQKTVYAYITYIFITAIAYTVSNLSYNTLLSLITDNQDERTTISSIRFIFTVLAIIVISTVSVKLIAKVGWSKLSIIYGLIALTFLMITAVFTRERNQPKEVKQQNCNIKTDVKVLFKNKYFIMITFIFIINYAGAGLDSGINIYYARDVLGDINHFALLNISALIPMLIGLMIFPSVAKRIGKWKSMFGGYIIRLVSLAIMAFASESLTGIIVATVIGSVGMVPMTAGLFALIADVVDYGEWTSGNRIDGLTYSAASFGMKVGTGIGTALVGWLLSYGNYKAGIDMQAASTIFAMKTIKIYMPIVLMIASAIIMYFLNIDKFSEKMNKDLAISRAQ
ncbi:MAG: MFS transporter [Sphaerochaeta sp.]